jgi:bleomycin hydrolase
LQSDDHGFGDERHVREEFEVFERLGYHPHNMNPSEENRMRRPIAFLAFSVLGLLLCYVLYTCSPEPKIIEKHTIQFGESDIQEKNTVLYETHAVRGEESTVLATDLSGIKRPAALDEFTQYFHFSPVRQHRTSTCWCFATTSFFESELKRMGRGEFKLSELYTVYWEFLEKARGFIRKKGNLRFTAGSEHNAVIARMKEYGAVPASAYTGLLPGQTEHDHSQLQREIERYLIFCKENGYWDEDKAVSYVRSILNKYLGSPPETIQVNGKTMTPREYLDNILQLPLHDYVSLISFKYLPFYTKGEFKVPDNWWHSEEYFNVPLEEFYEAITCALQNGYTVAFGGDVSEPGISGDEDIAIIPTFDTHPKLIDQDSREFRFHRKTSTDDHSVHAVGIKEAGEHTWFLIKDSGGSAQRGQFPGYYMYRDDYVKLKMLTIMVHRDAVADLLAPFPKANP